MGGPSFCIHGDGIGRIATSFPDSNVTMKNVHSDSSQSDAAGYLSSDSSFYGTHLTLSSDCTFELT